MRSAISLFPGKMLARNESSCTLVERTCRADELRLGIKGQNRPALC
jgi:hypothetical protein